MAYTGHGHHITGTKTSLTPPKQVARCGGPGICRECTRDAYLKLQKLIAKKEKKDNHE